MPDDSIYIGDDILPFEGSVEIPLYTDFSQSDSSDAYDIDPYSYDWDNYHNGPPVLDDYLKPWSDWSSRSPYEYTYGLSDRRDYNSKIAYAQQGYEAAYNQYLQDLARWSELDARDYNSFESQRERMEQAGFNLGYVYDKLESFGANASQVSDSGVKSKTNRTNEVNPIDALLRLGQLALSAYTGLSKLPFESALMESQTATNNAIRPYQIANMDSQTKNNLLANLIQSVKNGFGSDSDYAKWINSVDGRQTLAQLGVTESQAKELQSVLDGKIEYLQNLYSNKGDVNQVISEVGSQIDNIFRNTDLDWLGQILKAGWSLYANVNFKLN